jgi:hypothetical protein
VLSTVAGVEVYHDGEITVADDRYQASKANLDECVVAVIFA